MNSYGGSVDLIDQQGTRFASGMTIFHGSKTEGRDENCFVEVMKTHTNRRHHTQPEKALSLSFSRQNSPAPPNPMYLIEKKKHYHHRRPRKLVNSCIQSKSDSIPLPLPPQPSLPYPFATREFDQMLAEFDTVETVDGDKEVKVDMKKFLQEKGFFDFRMDNWVETDKAGRGGGCGGGGKKRSKWVNEQHQFVPIDRTSAWKRNTRTNQDLFKLTYEECLQGSEYVIIDGKVTSMKYKWMADENGDLAKVDTVLNEPLDVRWQRGVIQNPKKKKKKRNRFTYYQWVKKNDGNWIRINHLNGKPIGKPQSEKQMLKTLQGSRNL